MDDDQLRPGSAGRKGKAERDRIAFQQLRLIRKAVPDERQRVAIVPIKFQPPRLAVNDEQLPDADVEVEVELVPASVVGTDDFDGEVRPAEPMCIAVLGG